MLKKEFQKAWYASTQKRGTLRINREIFASIDVANFFQIFRFSHSDFLNYSTHAFPARS